MDDLAQVYSKLDPCSKPVWGAELIGSQETAKLHPPTSHVPLNSHQSCSTCASASLVYGVSQPCGLWNEEFHGVSYPLGNTLFPFIFLDPSSCDHLPAAQAEHGSPGGPAAAFSAHRPLWPRRSPHFITEAKLRSQRPALERAAAGSTLLSAERH